jgi:hypothetical protein
LPQQPQDQDQSLNQSQSQTQLQPQLQTQLQNQPMIPLIVNSKTYIVQLNSGPMSYSIVIKLYL